MSGPVRYIKQRCDVDCSVAALAMATGASYEDVLAGVAPLVANGHGINQNDAEDWLRDHGFAWQIIYQFGRAGDGFGKRSPWPPAPWAPSHLAQVVATRGNHFIAIDRSGRVFDPWDESRAALTDPVYREIHWLMGLWRVAPSPLTGQEGQGRI